MDFVELIGPEGFANRGSFQLAAARGNATLTTYLDSPGPKEILEDHLGIAIGDTWKSESAPGMGRRAVRRCRLNTESG